METARAGEVTEACLGAFCGAVREVSLDGASAVACSGMRLKVWDADAATCSHSFAVDGRVEQVALCGGLVAYVSHYYTCVRLLDLPSGRQRTLHGVDGRALSLTWAARHLVLFIQPLDSEHDSARCHRWIRVFNVPHNAMDEESAMPPDGAIPPAVDPSLNETSSTKLRNAEGSLISSQLVKCVVIRCYS